MKTNEARELIGQLCEFDLNGTRYRKIINGWITKVENGEATLKRIEGNDKIIRCRDIIDYKVLKEDKYRRCGVCLIGRHKLRFRDKGKIVNISKCDKCGYEPETVEQHERIYNIN